MIGNAAGPYCRIAVRAPGSRASEGDIRLFRIVRAGENWIVPILTLVLTLLLETFLGQSAGYQWRVGSVQLGGYNGMTGIPAVQAFPFIIIGYSSSITFS